MPSTLDQSPVRDRNPDGYQYTKKIFKGTIARKDKHSGTARVVRVLGNGQDDCKWRWYDASLVSRARSFESQDPMGGACSSSLNRPVWTRMPWWCGEVPGKGHPYPSYVGFQNVQ